MKKYFISKPILGGEWYAGSFGVISGANPDTDLYQESPSSDGSCVYVLEEE